MAERSKAMVLKTIVGQPTQGSNPCLSARNFHSQLIPGDELLFSAIPGYPGFFYPHYLKSISRTMGWRGPLRVSWAA